MIDLAKIYYIIFGALTIVGGVIGFIKKTSYASLVAGGLAGVVLLIAAVMLKDKPQAGLILGGIVSVLLAGRFIPAFIDKFNWMPAGMMSILSVLGIVFTLIGFAKK
jgi:uncharacterized membrane protein (UPF0136 family)